MGFFSPLNLHSQSSLFLPLITWLSWLSSDQSAASSASQMGATCARCVCVCVCYLTTMHDHLPRLLLVGQEQLATTSVVLI